MVESFGSRGSGRRLVGAGGQGSAGTVYAKARSLAGKIVTTL